MLETRKSKGYDNFGECVRIYDLVWYGDYEITRRDYEQLKPTLENYYQSLNPDYWVVYYKTGLYFYQQKDFAAAKVNFEKALTKEITTAPEKAAIEKYLEKIKRKLK